MSKLGCQCIGLKIGLDHFLCVIEFVDIDRMISPSIVIWNWIWVYLRSCICSKMSKVVCPYIGLGHFLCVILFEDIDKVVSESI